MTRRPDRPRLRVLLDEGVPVAVAEVFARHGHVAIPFKDAVVPGSPDPLVCAAAIANDAILVALDADMRQIARSHGVGKQRFARLSLIKLTCRATQSAARIEQAMSLFEHEWVHSEGKTARRLFIEIQDRTIKTNR